MPDNRPCQDDGVISLAFSGATQLSTCTDDDVMDRIRFQVRPFRQAFAYFVVDEANVIQYLGFSNFINFDLLPSGTLRVYAFSNYGRISASVGDVFSEDLVLSTPCAGLTTNFVTINNGTSGDIMIASEQDEYRVCPGDGNPDVIEFTSPAANVTYLVATPEGNLLATNMTGSIDFEGAGAGICIIYAFASPAPLPIAVGDNISPLEEILGCGIGLSENFITVDRQSTNGGSVTTTEGQTTINTCPGDGVDDFINFSVTDNVGDNNRLIVTDSDNMIIGLPDDFTINFEGAGAGVCRVWSLSFTGNFTAMMGDVLETSAFSDGCSDLSDDFVTVIREVTDGGTVTTDAGDTEISLCVGDGEDDIVNFTVSGFEGATNRLVVTDANNIIIGLPEGFSVNFEEAGVGVCRVWSLGFTGDFTLMMGDAIETASFSEGCSDLSDDFVAVTRETVNGGTILTDAGESSLLTCPGDGNDDFVTFAVTGDAGNNNRIIITDANNMIIGLPDGLTANFEDAGAGVCRAWNLNYTGNFTAMLGDNIAEATLADGCADLSDDFVTVTREAADGGTIATDSGETEIGLCVGDGVGNLVAFTVSGFQGTANRLVVTDENNIIIGLPGGLSVDFDGAGAGTCRVWSVGLTGDFSGAEGDPLETTTLSSGCFDLSDDFVTVIRETVNGGTILTDAGEFAVQTCPGDGNDDFITFSVTDDGGNNNRLIITDANNVIIGLPDGLTANFEDAGTGVCRAWNLNFTGNFTAVLGDIVTEATLADGCADLSDSFVTVTRETPVGGNILTTDGASQVGTCPGDGRADVIEVATTGNSGGDIFYVITDADNSILNFSATPSFDVEGAGVGNCRIWSFTYQGNTTLSPGVDITTASLADGCFELSADFVDVIRTVPAGGTVATSLGATELSLCPSDGLDDILTFVSTGAEGNNFAFVATDTNNVIVGLPEGDMINFEGAGFGVCRVWGLSYSGTLIAEIGDTASVEPLATDCFGLSDNFVNVRREQPNGGTIGLRSGDEEGSVCPGDGVADVLRFITWDVQGDNFAFVITDNDGNILGFPVTANIDFDEVDVGVCKVFSFVYSGTIIASIGDNINSPLASGCFDLSDNSIRIIRQEATTGPISTEAGETEIMACPGDAIPDFVRFDSTGTTLNNFNYLITDINNVVIRVAFTDRLNFENLPIGTCRVYGLGYDGIVAATPGDTAGVDPLATQCYALSENFVTVTKQLPTGGTLATDAGETEVMVCSMDGIADIVTAVAAGNSGENYTFVLTTDQNIILSVSANGVFDFDTAPFGTCRIWGLSYQGDLMAEAGQDAGIVQLSSDCFDLSDNFITVTREDVVGGSISLENGATEAFTCPSDGIADLLAFINAGATGTGYQYVVTDEDNMILALVDGDNFDFEPAGSGVCRVWGFAFAGTVTAMAGDNASTTDLASGCFALSDNFITVIRDTPNGGSVSLEDGRLTTEVCSGVDSEPALNFITTSASAGYTFLIVQDSFVLTAIGDTFNFNMANGGTYLIYGLAYAGNLSVGPATNIFTEDLASSCFELSDTFITVNVTRVDGGDIMGNGAEEVYLCDTNQDDGMVTFTTNSGRAGANYRYVIAFANGVILSVLDDGVTEFDFSSLPLMELKVHAISYTGEFLATAGVTLDGAPLATGCVDISNNCIRILNDTPEGGTISFDNVPGTGISCTVDGDGTISISSTSESFTGYAGIVTDTNNVILLVSADPTNIDLGSLPQDSTYRVWGLAYTGNLTAILGDILTDVALADNCFELSDNSLEVVQGGSISAGILINETTEGTGDTITWCLPGDTPIAVVGASVSGPNYRYIVTNEDGRIRATNLPSNIIPFFGFAPGCYRIYGFNFTGMSLLGINQNINTTILSTECGALTSNYITVKIIDPDGGMVTTADGSTEVEVEIDGMGGSATAFVDFTNDSDSLNNYVYLVTDENDMVLALSNENRFNFGPAGVGVCRVWGVAYTGELTASPGDVITEVALSDGCFGLSANFLQVTRVDEVNIDGTGGVIEESGMISELSLTARPNPTSGGTLYLDISSFSTIPNGQVSVRDMNGTAYSVSTLIGGGEEATVQLDISMLPAGMYFVMLATEEGLQSVRFMKE